MNTTVLTLIVLRLIAAIICIVGAVHLMERGIDGWGWLLFAAIVLGYVDIRVRKEDDKDEA